MRFVNDSGPSEYSPIVSVTTLPGLPAPATLTGNADSVRVTLSWSAVPGATSYRIWDGSKSGGPYSVIGQGVSGTQYVHQGLASNSTHFYLVAGVNASGEGQRSTELSVTTLPGVASLTVQPTAVKGGKKATGTVTLDHQAPTSGAVVTLASRNRSAARVPARVTIPAGATSATFTVTTRKVTKKKGVTLTAGYGGTTKTAVVTVRK